MNFLPKLLIERYRSVVRWARCKANEADSQAKAEDQVPFAAEVASLEAPSTSDVALPDDLDEEVCQITLDRRGINKLDQSVLTKTWISLCEPGTGAFHFRDAKQRAIEALCNPRSKILRLTLDPGYYESSEWDHFCCDVIVQAVRRKDSTIRELELHNVGINHPLIGEVASALVDPKCNLTSLIIEENTGRSLSNADAFIAALENPQCKLRHVALDTMGEREPYEQKRLFDTLSRSGRRLQSLALSVKGASHEELDPLVALFGSQARTLRSFKLTQSGHYKKTPRLTLWQPNAENRVAPEMMGESMFAQLSQLLLDPVNRLERLQLDIAFYFISLDSLLLGITSPFNNLRVFALDAGEEAFDKMPYNVVSALANWMKRPGNRLEDLRLSLQIFPEEWWQPILDALESPHNRLVRLHIDHWLSIDGDAGRWLLPTYMHLAQSLGSPNNKLRHLRFTYLKALNGLEQFRRALFRSNLSSFWSSVQPTHGPQMHQDCAFDLFLAQRWLQVGLTLASIACVPRLAENALCKEMPMMDFIRIIAHTLGWFELMETEPYLRGCVNV